MTDITKLADKWQRRQSKPWQGCASAATCIRELREALPTWTRFTADTETWPSDGQHFVYMDEVKSNPDHLPYYETWTTECGEYISHWIDTLWRPLCDLDYPPEPE